MNANKKKVIKKYYTDEGSLADILSECKRDDSTVTLDDILERLADSPNIPDAIFKDRIIEYIDHENGGGANAQRILTQIKYYLTEKGIEGIKFTLQDVRTWKKAHAAAQPAAPPAAPPNDYTFDKFQAIDQVYYENQGFGSIAETVKQTKKHLRDQGITDYTVTAADVRKWKEENLDKKKQLRGYNSFIVDAPHVEYQMDLFFLTDLPPDRRTAKTKATALLMVDIFSKWTQVVPVKTKSKEPILSAIRICVKGMGEKPKIMYTDSEPSFLSTPVQNYFAEEGIRHLTTLNHAAYAERQIRTIKDMLYKGLERYTKDNPYQDWKEIMPEVITTYNTLRVHNVTKLTPADATVPENRTFVLMNLERARKTNRPYPEIKVGDYVRVFKKRAPFAKERVPVWLPEKHKVVAIVPMDVNKYKGGKPEKFYEVEGQTRLLERSEILLVNAP
jgi:hypothetical protein